MAKQFSLRKGTTAQHATFTGAVAEITVDTTKDVVVVHDGVTVGGFPLASARDITSANINITSLQSNSISHASSIAQFELDFIAANARIDVIDSYVISSNVTLTEVVANVDSVVNGLSLANLEIGLLNANVTSANLVISDLSSNAEIQASEIQELQANIIAANLAIAAIVGSNLEAINSNVSSIGDNTHSLGASDHQWHDIWLSNAMQFNGVTLTCESGNLIVDGTNHPANIMIADFTMANVTHWTSNVYTIGDALNQLASRIYSIQNP